MAKTVIVDPSKPDRVRKKRRTFVGQIKNIATGLDGREYECIGRYISNIYCDVDWEVTSKNTADFKGQPFQWGGIVIHIHN